MRPVLPAFSRGSSPVLDTASSPVLGTTLCLCLLGPLLLATPPKGPQPPLTQDAEAQDGASSRPATQPEATPYRSLFDGKTLKGWTTRGGRYDGNAVWTVEDGALTGREGKKHAGGLIYTDRRFRSFDLELEAKIDYPFDSGIFLHMTKEAKGLQITLDYRPGGEVGGIYSEGWLQHNPEGAARFKRDAWNKLRVRCTGTTPKVIVWLNGKVLTRFEQKRNAKGFTNVGLIGLQVHGNRNDPRKHAARFRKIRIRELPCVDDRLFDVDERGQLHAKPTAKKMGWRNLLAGGLLDWESIGGKTREPRDGYLFEKGVLSFPRKGPGGYLRTKEDFRDFELRLDFKLAFMCNSGLFLRGDRKGGNPAYSGCEIQILDDLNWETTTKTKLKKWQFTGSLYGSTPPAIKDALRRPGAWNSYEVRYVGKRLSVRLNGLLLYDVDTHAAPGNPPFAKRAKTGFIGLQRHAPAQVRDAIYASFRNIWVRKVEAKAKELEEGKGN